jgi:hypothetical protein
MEVRLNVRAVSACLLLSLSSLVADGQDSPSDTAQDPGSTKNVAPALESKRLLGIVPNYRTSPEPPEL